MLCHNDNTVFPWKISFSNWLFNGLVLLHICTNNGILFYVWFIEFTWIWFSRIHFIHNYNNNKFSSRDCLVHFWRLLHLIKYYMTMCLLYAGLSAKMFCRHLGWCEHINLRQQKPFGHMYRLSRKLGNISCKTKTHWRDLLRAEQANSQNVYIYSALTLLIIHVQACYTVDSLQIDTGYFAVCCNTAVINSVFFAS